MMKGKGVVGLLLLAVGLTCSGIAHYLHDWIDNTDTVKYHGIWKYKFGNEDGNWPDDVSSYSSDTRLFGYGIRYSTCTGSGVMFLAMIFILCYFCGQGKRVFATIGAILCMISAVSIAAAATLFHLKFKNKNDDVYGVGFYLVVASGCLVLLTGIFMIFVAARPDNRVQDRGDEKTREEIDGRIDGPTAPSEGALPRRLAPLSAHQINREPARRTSVHAVLQNSERNLHGRTNNEINSGSDVLTDERLQRQATMPASVSTAGNSDNVRPVPVQRHATMHATTSADVHSNGRHFQTRTPVTGNEEHLPRRTDVQPNRIRGRIVLNSAGIQILTIKRTNILKDVLNVYNLLDIEQRIMVTFEGERGQDIGGLTREMFSLFWEAALEKYFTGRERVIPFISATGRRKIANKVFPILGKIIAHMWILFGHFPLQMAKCCMLKIADQNLEIEPAILLEDYLAYIPEAESLLLQRCLDLGSWTQDQTRQLERIYSLHRINFLPSLQNLRDCILDIAQTQMLDNSQVFFMHLRRGFAVERSEALLRSLLCSNIHLIYEQYGPTPDSVAKLIDDFYEDNDLQHQEQAVVSHLSNFIRELNQRQVLRFLRWATGAIVMPENITVNFTSRSGFSRTPVAHTCGRVIDISTQYDTYEAFKNEFLTVIESDEAFVFSTL